MINQLRFEEAPDYEYLRSLLRDLLNMRCPDKNVGLINLFDWNLKATIIQDHEDMYSSLIKKEGKLTIQDNGQLQVDDALRKSIPDCDSMLDRIYYKSKSFKFARWDSLSEIKEKEKASIKTAIL